MEETRLLENLEESKRPKYNGSRFSSPTIKEECQVTLEEYNTIKKILNQPPVRVVECSGGYVYMFSNEPNYPSPYEWMIDREDGTIEEIVIDPLTGKEIDDKTQTDT